MKTEITCKRCETVIANDNGAELIPVKNRTRYNYKDETANIQCHNCYFVNIYKGRELVDDCEKKNNKYQLEKTRK